MAERIACEEEGAGRKEQKTARVRVPLVEEAEERGGVQGQEVWRSASGARATFR